MCLLELLLCCLLCLFFSSSSFFRVRARISRHSSPRPAKEASNSSFVQRLAMSTKLRPLVAGFFSSLTIAGIAVALAETLSHIAKTMRRQRTSKKWLLKDFHLITNSWLRPNARSTRWMHQRWQTVACLVHRVPQNSIAVNGQIKDKIHRRKCGTYEVR